MSVWDKIFGKGEDHPRDGPAHSSDRHGFWKDLWKLRKSFEANIEHSGSVDIYDHFGTVPYNDNHVKQERRDVARPILLGISKVSKDDELKAQITALLAAFEAADLAQGLSAKIDAALPHASGTNDA
jgi:hypothetical protein